MPCIPHASRRFRDWLAPIFRALPIAAAACLSLASPHAARGQCSQWADSGHPAPPRPAFLPASYAWTPPLGDMVYDSRRRVCVLFGGDTPNHLTSVYFTHRYDGTSWVYESLPLTSTLPPYRGSPTLVFDAARGRTLMFGGQIGTKGTNDLWEYDGTNWYQRPVAGAWPRPAFRNPICYDPYRARAIMLGVSPTSDRFETWEWNGAAWDRGPDLAGVDTGTALTRMVFDVARNRAFVYTKATTDHFERVYEFTPGAGAAQGAWRNISIAGSPYPALFATSLVYDPGRQLIFRIAGRNVDDIYGYEAQTFVWSVPLSKWLQLSATSDGLPVRSGAAAVFDTGRDRIVLYGGFRSYIDSSGTGRATTYTDTWEYAQGSPGITNQPAPATVDGGQTAIFAATAIGDGNSLQWLHDGAPIAGATGPFLSVSRASQAGAGLYVLRVSNACGVLDSLPARLTVRAPVNDSPLTPSVIYASTLTGTTLGATAGGTAACGSSTASPDVWYKYTAPNPGNLTIDTCGSDFDTVLSFHGCCPGPGPLLGCSFASPLPGCTSNTSSLSTTVTQGQQFLVRVSGVSGAAGNFTLNTRLVPFNNSCSAATPVLAGTYVGTTVGASVDGSASCGNSNTTPDIWYRFRSDCSGTLGLDTQGSSFDTVMSVRTSCTGTELTCNDDVQAGTTWSYVSLTVQPGINYSIRVSGFNGATGSVVLHVYPPIVPGDACAGAVPIGLGQRLFATGCATTTALGLPPWCEQASGAVPFYDVWYRYTAAAPGTLEARICDTTFNASLAVYGSSCPTSAYDAFVCAAREDSCGTTALGSWPTLPGEQYLLRIGGYFGLNPALAGTGTIELTLVPFETGACCLSLGGCAPTSAYECAGVFYGEGSACAPSPCPSQAGYCCTGAQCTVMEPSACTTARGTFGGTGSPCLQSSLNPVTCCSANINAVGGVTVQDIFDFFTAWFSRDPRADLNADGATTIQDIFDFLAAWFAKC